MLSIYIFEGYITFKNKFPKNKFNKEQLYEKQSGNKWDKRSRQEIYKDLKKMALEVDVLICITPGGPETEKIVNEEILTALGPTGILINVARGSVVDETALVEALENGRLGYAALDVFENEPEVPEKLIKMENVTLLPHVGSATFETRAAMSKLTLDNLLTYKRKGQVLTPVPECLQISGL